MCKITTQDRYKMMGLMLQQIIKEMFKSTIILGSLSQRSLSLGEGISKVNRGTTTISRFQVVLVD
jgi:hypothetical protein